MNPRRAACLIPAFALLLCGCSGDDPAAPEAKNPALSPTTVITVAEPERSAMIEAGSYETSPVAVSGTACDPDSPIQSLVIAGTAVDVNGPAACTNFSVEHSSRWGLNLIEGTATNESGFVSSLTHSYMRSPRYFDPGAVGPAAERRRLAERVARAFDLQMTQGFVDDGSRSSLDDLAALIQARVTNLGLNDLPTTLVPGPGRSTCDCFGPVPDIQVDNSGVKVLRGGAASSGPLVVEAITLGPDRIDVRLSTTQIVFPLDVTGYLSECVTACTTRTWIVQNVTGALRADRVQLTARVVANGVDAQGAPVFDALASSIDLTVTGLRLDIDWGPLSFLESVIDLNTLASTITGWFQANLEQLAGDAMVEQLIPALEDTFDSLELPDSITLAAPFGVTLLIDGQLDALDITTAAIHAGIAASVTPAVVTMPSPRGSLYRGGAAPTFGSSGFELGIAAKDDFVNQFLWAMWQGGAFDLADLSALGVGTPASLPDGVVISAKALLPPVLMPGTGTLPLDLALGDVWMQVKLGETAVASLYASSLVGASLGYDSAQHRLSLELDPAPVVSVQWVEVPAGVDVEALAAEYRDLARSLALEWLTNAVESVPIPAFEVGAAGVAGIPSDLRWVVGNGSIERQGAYHVIKGSVEIE